MFLRKLSLVAASLLLLAGACVSPSSAVAQGTPAQWNYSFINGIANATYPGLVNGVFSAPVVITGNTSAASANAASINSAILTVSIAGGGTVQLPCGQIYISSPIDNNVPRVLVQGCGTDWFHDASGAFAYGTTILPTVAMTVLRHRTIPGNNTTPVNNGGGFIWLNVDANGVGTRLLEVTSIRGGSYDLYLKDSVGTEAAYFGSLVSNTTTGEAADNQHLHVNLRIRQIDGTIPQAANGVVFDGSSNANFSMNNDVHLAIQHYNGDAIVCKNADNNFIEVQATRPGGTGRTITAYGTSAGNPSGCAVNNFYHVSGAGAIYARGTNDGDTAGVQNVVGYLDTGNGTPIPTAGTGSRWTWFNNLYSVSGQANLTRSIIGDGDAAVNNAYSTQSTTSSLEIVNGSGDHMRLRDQTATNSWGIDLNGSSLRFLQIAGAAGTVQAPSITLSAGGYIKVPTFTFATIPGCPATVGEGSIVAVTDSNSATFNAVLAGGGTNHVLAYCNGTNWTVH